MGCIRAALSTVELSINADVEDVVERNAVAAATAQEIYSDLDWSVDSVAKLASTARARSWYGLHSLL